MAQDDMHVVMYKILSYLYVCMKEGEKPKRSLFSAEALGISKSYWDAIMRELAERHLVKGVSAMATSEGDFIHLGNARITLDGVEFLMENSMMAKARQFLIDIKAAVPFV